MRSLEFPSGVITTILKRNLPELPPSATSSWRISPGRGSCRSVGPWAASPTAPETGWNPGTRARSSTLRHRWSATRSIVVDLADCLGYYTVQNREVSASRGQDRTEWVGCHAGKRAFGIRHNGDIAACNSIRDGSGLEGNVREVALAEIWTRPGAFRAFRARSRESLTGVCRACQFGELCLAGCTSARRSLCGSDGEYAFCAYRQSLERLFGKIDGMTDTAALVRRADRAAILQLLDVAARCLARAHQLDPHDLRRPPSG